MYAESVIFWLKSVHILQFFHMRCFSFIAIVLLVVARATARPVTSEECGLSLPTCCMALNSTNELAPMDAQCACLETGEALVNQTVAPGGYIQYHWVVTDYQNLDFGHTRRSVTFEVQPCVGSASLFVRELQPPFPTADDHHHGAEHAYASNVVTLPVLRAQYLVSVYGSDNDFGFSPAVATELDVASLPDELISAASYGEGSNTSFIVAAYFNGS